jgi:hypothetical protein
VVTKSTPEQPIDYIFADLKICGTRLLVGIIYTPPRIDGYLFYGPILEELTSKEPRHIVMGVNVFRDTSASRNFLEQLNALSLTVVNNDEPTTFGQVRDQH